MKKTNIDIELLTKLFMIHSPSGKENEMKGFVREYAEALGAKCKEDEMGNLYVTKGVTDTYYPCVVAHLDEVHRNKPCDFEVKISGDIMFGFSNSKKDFVGIGADDKNGIYVALECIKSQDVIKCAFFVQEEVGCVGSRSADMVFFKDCRFVLQCDRRNSGDMITEIGAVKLCSKRFIKDANISRYGYEETSGMMTDVLTLKQKKIGISCCNISCGYYKPHTDIEFTLISGLSKCMDFVTAIIEDCVDVYKHTEIAVKRNYHEWELFDDDYEYYGHGIPPINRGLLQSRRIAQLTELERRMRDIIGIAGDINADNLYQEWRYRYRDLTCMDFRDTRQRIIYDYMNLQ